MADRPRRANARRKLGPNVVSGPVSSPQGEGEDPQGVADALLEGIQKDDGLKLKRITTSPQRTQLGFVPARDQGRLDDATRRLLQDVSNH